jgi:hypothetical protein
MVQSPIDAPAPTLDARWIIALWVAIHGAETVLNAGGELILDGRAARAAAGNAIRALATQLDAGTAAAIRAALPGAGMAPEGVSDGQVEDALKRLGIRLFGATNAGDAPVSGLAVAGFGRIAWTQDEA